MVSTGDIKDKKYKVLGIVGAVVNDQAVVNKQAETASCGGPVNTKVLVSTDPNTMYNKGADKPLDLAKEKGGDAVIYASFEYRIALSGAGQLAKQVKELFCYGTAVKLGS